MNDNEIRRTILKKLYVAERAQPGTIIPSNKLSEELGIPKEDMGFNVKYLYEKGFIIARQLDSQHYSALVNITHYGIDILEDESEFNRKFPLKIINVQNSDGTVINSSNVNIDINKSVNIENSFNELYNEIYKYDNPEEVKIKIIAIEEELNKDKVDISKIRELISWFQFNASWAVFPLTQIILSLYGLTLPR